MLRSGVKSLFFSIFWLLFLSGSLLAYDSCGTAEINNVKLYYEITGKGFPLLYLHGGLSSLRDFDKYLPAFSDKYKVITVDRRGHGRSADNEKPYSYSTMADEINLFLDYLEIDSAFVIGWSDGGVVGYHLAGRYPSKVKKLIAVGANYLVDGMTESAIQWIKTNLTPENISAASPGIEKAYKEINPAPANFQNFITKTREMWLRDPYIPKDDLSKIKTPVLLAAGDNDDIRIEHMAELHKLIKTSRLYIIPNTTHFLFGRYNNNAAKVFMEFLDEK